MAFGINKQILVGNIGKIENRVSPSGTVLCNFSVATGARVKDKQGNYEDETTWHNCVAFNKLAEVMRDYCAKGKKVYVEGQTKHEKYEKDGETKYITKVIVNQLQILSPKDEAAKPVETSSTAYENVDSVPFDDSIPF